MASEDFHSHPLAHELVTWFTQNGGSLSPDVHVVHSDSHGFHMRALRPLSSPVVASCPIKLTLSSLNLDPTEKEVLHVESPLRQCQGRIPNHILTYLLLVEERNKANVSPWYAYIACLPGPESMTTPLWFNEEDTAFLTGTGLAPAARERKEDMHRQWEQAVTVMEELGIALASEVNFNMFLWAATIFTSRAFISTHILPDRETTPLLFPVVDILNHSVSAKVEWDFQPHQSFSLKCLEGETFESGQELFNNYAPKQNDELLLGYGFCLEDNPIEQFALKLVFPTVLQEYAQEMNLLHPNNVPFGMSSTFLDTDPNTEHHFLRTKGHPFGRYENSVPCFRGIPPYIVHFFFIQTLLARDADVCDVNVRRPEARITLQVLLLLHSAIEQRCQGLPLMIDRKAESDKQKYAKIYRDGQARIIHSIRHELKAAVDRVRTPSGEILHQRPVLVSILDVTAAFEVDFPTDAQRFRTALLKHGLAHSDDETLMWTLLLTVAVSLILMAHNQKHTLFSSWLRDLFIRHPLPSLEDGIEDVETYTFVDAHLADFLYLSSPDEDASPTDVLDDLGLTFMNQPVDGLGTPVFINGRTENLGVRIVMWAMRVAEQEAMPVFENGGLKKCLYVRPWLEEDVRGDEEWMYEDADVGSN